MRKVSNLVEVRSEWKLGNWEIWEFGNLGVLNTEYGRSLRNR